MADERSFIRENVNRTLIKEFLLKKIEGAGFGGMNIQRTPLGTRISILVERPGMVIGRGGNKIKELTDTIREKFKVDNPQIEIEEAADDKAALNAQIMAEKLAEALERGWHFRRAGHSTVRRIMEAGAKGCQVIISGKLTGDRHRTEKFTEGHVKYCGETAREVMDEGCAVAKLKPGILGVKIRIMKPDAKLPDEIKLKEVIEIEKSKEEKKIEAPIEKKEKTDIKKIVEMKDIGPAVVKKLQKAGFNYLEDLLELDVDDIKSIEGIDKKTAQNIVKNLRKFLSEVTKDGS